MFFLPKGSPLFESIPASKLTLPDVFAKLSSAHFTGYVSFLFPAATTIMVFESGKLGDVLCEEEGGARQTGREALARLSDLMLSTQEGSMSMYKLSPRLCSCIRALLRGTVMYRAQELKLLNIRGLLQQIGSERLTGCLRTYTHDRSSMLFYREGAPLGFFHDGSHDLESSVTEPQQIASLPGAKIDLFSTPGMDQPLERDLPEEVNIRELWDGAVSRQRNGRGGGTQQKEE